MGYLNVPLITVISVAEKYFAKVPQAGSCQNACKVGYEILMEEISIDLLYSCICRNESLNRLDVPLQLLPATQ